VAIPAGPRDRRRVDPRLHPGAPRNLTAFGPGLRHGADITGPTTLVYMNAKSFPESSASCLSATAASADAMRLRHDADRRPSHLQLDQHLDRFLQDHAHLSSTRVPQQSSPRSPRSGAAANLPTCSRHEDYGVSQRVSRGTDVPGGDVYQSGAGPTRSSNHSAAAARRGRTMSSTGNRRHGSVGAARLAYVEQSAGQTAHNYRQPACSATRSAADQPKRPGRACSPPRQPVRKASLHLFIVRDGVVYTCADRTWLFGSPRTVIAETAGLGIGWS